MATQRRSHPDCKELVEGDRRDKLGVDPLHRGAEGAAVEGTQALLIEERESVISIDNKESNMIHSNLIHVSRDEG